MYSKVARYDQGEIDPAEITPEGYLRAEAIVTRAGVFLYQNLDGSVRKELRHPNDVFTSESLATLKMRPITNGHPAQKLVNADNYKDLAIGYTGESININAPYISTCLLVTDKQGVAAIKEQGRKELSLGYTVDLVEESGVYNGEEYTHRQTNIKYNHLAIVDRGRAGPEARIHLDEHDATQIVSNNNNKIKEEEMEKDNFSTVTLDGIDYKASPEVINAYKKAQKELTELKANLDSKEVEFEKMKADKDHLQEKLDNLEMVNLDEKIHEAVKLRANLINNACKLLANDIEAAARFDSMSNTDIMKSVIKAKHTHLNVDEVSDVYIQARFDALVEDYDASNEKMTKQREQVAHRADNEPSKYDVEASRQRMLDRLFNNKK